MGKSEHLIKPGADDTESDTVCTPSAVLDPIYENFEYIALDPYSHPSSIVVAETYVELEKYSHVDHHDWHRLQRTMFGDGNAIKWPLAGLVYVNSPWSDLHPPLEKIHREAQCGVEIIALLPARMGHAAVQDYVSRATSVLFWRGRMKFLNQKDTAPFQTMLAYWGKRPELFAKCWPKMWRVGA